MALWVPAFEDQRSQIRDREEPAEHIPLSEAERWEIAELAFAALGTAIPDRAVYFGSSRPTATSCFTGTSTGDTTTIHPNTPSATGSMRGDEGGESVSSADPNL